MKQFMMFSGGYDSTYLLDKLMSENNEVTILTIEADFLMSKVDRENIARERILSYLKSKYYGCTLIAKKLKLSIRECNIDSSGLSQVLFWLPSICMFTPPNEDTMINFSYIVGDQELSHKDDIREMIRISSHFRNKSLSGKFCMEYMHKHTVIEQLISKDKFLFENATTCEDAYADEDFCGKCVPCNNLKSALLHIIADSHTDDSIRSYCQDFLKLKFRIDISVSHHKNIELSNDKREETYIQCESE